MVWRGWGADALNSCVNVTICSTVCNMFLIKTGSIYRLTDPHSTLSTPVPASMDQQSEMTSENVEHDMSQLTAARAQCSKNLAASWTLDDNSLVGKLFTQLWPQWHAILVYKQILIFYSYWVNITVTKILTYIHTYMQDLIVC